MVVSGYHEFESIKQFPFHRILGKIIGTFSCGITPFHPFGLLSCEMNDVSAAYIRLIEKPNHILRLLIGPFFAENRSTEK